MFGFKKAPAEDKIAAGGVFSSVKRALRKTSAQLGEAFATIWSGPKIIDAALLEDIETHLLQADVGVATTDKVINLLTQEISRGALDNKEILFATLQQCLVDVLLPCQQPLIINTEQQPFVILMVGINGAGKTTTIGKLAKHFQQEGKRVMLAAGDTFRAAAVEQLQAWGERNNVPVIAQQSGADSAAVIFDAYQAAKAKKYDVLIADTAGRLHTQQHLMEELKKIKRVIAKVEATAPHEVMLVLDASLGQNGLQQARQFQEAMNVTGITLTKLDGTAKGGIVFAIADELKIPIRFVGLGEGIDDLQPFNAQTFVEALLAHEAE